MIDLKTLRLITQNGLQNFAVGRILDGIAALRTLTPYCATETIICAEADSLEENYHHMLTFLRQGGDDKKRSEVQAKIQRGGIALLEQVSRAIRLSIGSDRYCKAHSELIQNSKFKIQEDTPLAESLVEVWGSLLTPEETGEVQDDLFDLLWTSPLWTAQDTAFWYDFILGQQDMVQQHLAGALFLSVCEYYDAEKMQLLNLLADSECHRTRITAVTYLLMLRLRHKELAPLMPSLPDSLRSRKGRGLIAQVGYEMLLMLLSEKNMKEEHEEAEALSKKLAQVLLPHVGKDKEQDMPPMRGDLEGTLRAIIEMKGRYLKKRLQRGLDPNLTKTPLLHSCKYMQRISHWFLPFDKNHPLFQSVMIDENGNEKQKLSILVDLILDCDVDKLAMLYLVANDKDFSKAVQQLDEQEIPDFENAIIPEYTFRFIMQDLYRFFVHSPLHSQLVNPFREEQTLLDFPDIAVLFSADDSLNCCSLLIELERDKQALDLIDDLIGREGASAPALLLKGKALINRVRNEELRVTSLNSAISCLRSAEILQPDNAEVLRLLTECYAALHRFEEELEYLQRLAELFPDDESYRHLIPMTMVKAGREEEALQLFFKLDYEKEEDDEVIVASIAATAFGLGKLDIAERYTEKELLLSKGKQWQAHLRAGHIKLLRGDWKGSIDSYEQFVNTFCEKTGKDANAALKLFDEEQEMLTEKSIAREDLLLIHDIIQTAAYRTS